MRMRQCVCLRDPLAPESRPRPQELRVSNRYSRSHLDDQALELSIGSRAGGERHATADFLSDIAEYDARRLYLPRGYEAMYAYCLGELKLSEDAAVMRIGAA